MKIIKSNFSQKLMTADSQCIILSLKVWMMSQMVCLKSVRKNIQGGNSCCKVLKSHARVADIEHEAKMMILIIQVVLKAFITSP